MCTLVGGPTGSLVDPITLAAYTQLTGVQRQLLVGDSISNGVGASAGNGYHARLVAYFVTDAVLAFCALDNVGNTADVNYPNSWKHVQNGAKIATFNDGGANDADISVAPAVTARTPKIVLSMLGTNDMGNDTDAAAAPAAMQSLLERWRVINSTARCGVLTIPPATENTINTRINTYNSALVTVVANQVALGQSVILIDTGLTQADMDGGDGTHPPTAGHQKIADNIIPILRGMCGYSAVA